VSGAAKPRLNHVFSHWTEPSWHRKNHDNPHEFLHWSAVDDSQKSWQPLKNNNNLMDSSRKDLDEADFTFVTSDSKLSFGNPAWVPLILWMSAILMIPVSHAEEPEAPTIILYEHPNTVWVYDDILGQTYGPIWAQGAIIKGAYHSFTWKEPVNKYGNYGEAKGGWLDADLKIAVFGSSFTAPETTELFQERLSEKLGRSVHVLNFSIGSTGILSIFDVARAKVPVYKPDLMLFTYNATAYRYPRIWRFNEKNSDHFWRFVQSLVPGQTIHPEKASIHGQILITDLITHEWVDRMDRAKEEGDEETLRNDPLIRQFIEEYNQLQDENKKKQEQYGTVHIALLEDYSYLADRRFIDNAEFVNSTGIPYYMTHLPTKNELDADNQQDFYFHAVGVPEKQGRQYVEEVNKITGKEVVHLVDYYDPELLKTPEKLVQSEADGHPGQDGIAGMADAFIRLILDDAKSILEAKGL
jgi:hypothetical protein